MILSHVNAFPSSRFLIWIFAKFEIYKYWHETTALYIAHKLARGPITLLSCSMLSISSCCRLVSIDIFSSDI